MHLRNLCIFLQSDGYASPVLSISGDVSEPFPLRRAGDVKRYNTGDGGKVLSSGGNEGESQCVIQCDFCGWRRMFSVSCRSARRSDAVSRCGSAFVGGNDRQYVLFDRASVKGEPSGL